MKRLRKGVFSSWQDVHVAGQWIERRAPWFHDTMPFRTMLRRGCCLQGISCFVSRVFLAELPRLFRTPPGVRRGHHRMGFIVCRPGCVVHRRALRLQLFEIRRLSGFRQVSRYLSGIPGLSVLSVGGNLLQLETRSLSSLLLPLSFPSIVSKFPFLRYPNEAFWINGTYMIKELVCSVFITMPVLLLSLSFPLAHSDTFKQRHKLSLICGFLWSIFCGGSCSFVLLSCGVYSQILL